MPTCTLQLFVDGAWKDAGRLDVSDLERGHLARSRLNYDDIYALDHFEAVDHRALSVRYSAGLELYTDDTWPAFVLDILPKGAGRAALLGALGQADSNAQDWPLLVLGAGNPPGNLRVAEAVKADIEARGFSRAQVETRDADFIEAMYQAGAIIGGSSGVQGEAPKFLLTEADDGLFYVDASLADERARRHWLVKYPRTLRDADLMIVHNEARYHAVAGRLGLRTHGHIELSGDALFIPRFDRAIAQGGVQRFGQESLASLAGVAAFGTYPHHGVLVEALSRHLDDPVDAVAEYVARDAVSLALGNTDNHFRNTAVSKCVDGSIVLSPVFDLAPMFLAEEGIPRATRWGERLERGHEVDWSRVIESLPLDVEGRDGVRRRLQTLAVAMADLPKLLEDEGVDSFIIERRSAAIATVTKGLALL